MNSKVTARLCEGTVLYRYFAVPWLAFASRRLVRLFRPAVIFALAWEDGNRTKYSYVRTEVC